MARASTRCWRALGSAAMTSSSFLAMMVLLALLGQTTHVFVVALIGDLDQAFVKPALIGAAFVAPNQQDGLSLGIKCECHPPDLTVPREAQLLHIGVARPFERIDRGASQVRTEF